MIKAVLFLIHYWFGLDTFNIQIGFDNDEKKYE